MWQRLSSVHEVWTGEPGALRAYALAAAMTLAEGTTMVASGPARFSSPAWHAIDTFGGPPIFGSALLTLGIALVLAPLVSATVVRGALLFCSIAHLLLGFSFVYSAVSDPRAGLTGIVLYFVIGFWLMSQREMYRP